MIGPLVLTLMACGCAGPPDVNAVFEQLSEARRLAANLQVKLTKASDAANHAVMAIVDEQSRAAALEARQGLVSVQQDADALAPLLDRLAYREEAAILSQFNGRFSAYRALEEDILGLAVENTNTKARRLAFGEAQEAADALRQSLDELQVAPGVDAWHVKGLRASAVAAVRDIQVLQAPHIAEATDAVMENLERRMTVSEGAARSALEQLRPLVTSATRPRLDAAVGHFDRFLRLNAEIVALSRRNTNVRSLALSLEQKRSLQKSCEESLQTLREALADRRHVGRRWP